MQTFDFQFEGEQNYEKKPEIILPLLFKSASNRDVFITNSFFCGPGCFVCVAGPGRNIEGADYLLPEFQQR
jgi:hypothetical protein